MLDAGGLFWADAPDGFDINSPDWKLFHVFREDDNKYILSWVARPELIVMCAMKNNDILIAKAIDGTPYTGENVINMIQNCSIRLYDKVGEWWL